LAARAKVLAAGGNTRLAGHLIELASAAAPAAAEIQAVRAMVDARCVAAETSLIGKEMFAVYQPDAEARWSG
jgi:hypothetical protein